MEKTKRLEKIPGLEEGSFAVIKKFSWGESGAIKSKAIQFKINAQKQEGTLDLLEAQMLEMIYGIKEASFIPAGSTEAQKRTIFSDLPAESGNYLFNEIDGFNSPTEEIQKK